MSSPDRLDHVTTKSPTCGSCGCHGDCTCTCTCHGGGGPGTDKPPLQVLTPFLVIPCAPGDPGARPLPAAQALYNQAIGWTVANPAAPGGWKDFQLQVSCKVANLGPFASATAMIEFFIVSQLGIRHKGHATLSPADVRADAKLLGRATITAPPGVVTAVRCPVAWRPGSYKAALQGIVVQVNDLFTDPWTAPFDAIHDRHVGRNDDTMRRVRNTGVDVNAAPLAPGASDPNWDLAAGPAIGAPQPAVVVTEQHPGGSAYFPSTDSAWIWANAAGSAGPGTPYTFRLRIDLSGLDPASVTIGGAWGVDNDGTISFNGQRPIGTGTFSLTNADHDNYNVAHPFAITGGFQAGINNLDFEVTNVDGPAALNVTRLTITGTPA
ncbi:MAG: hypothetical protein QOF48_170 [Verrucomicrobiota bacterium]